MFAHLESAERNAAHRYASYPLRAEPPKAINDVQSQDRPIYRQGK
jgi:hypothetical protein